MKLYKLFLSSLFLMGNSCYGSSNNEPVDFASPPHHHNTSISPLWHSYEKAPSMKINPSRLNLNTIDAEKLSKLPLEDLNMLQEEDIKQINPETLAHLTYKYALADKMVNNSERSTALLRLGALGDCLIAKKEYASRLWRGKGVKENSLEALKWYIEAAEKRDADSINFLKRAERENKLTQYFGENIPPNLMERILKLPSFILSDN
ncbi:hypothetical protein [Candidatus Paracaedibacter symbiosus]|uniref:hypothetical protein n=1 Tax=Candidatus Paracaedibacter symbiosus TaxID=244582 RepID=UPI000509D339|nr:hypothetical protein [Candidatus Paracaedibacter symbiosus]